MRRLVVLASRLSDRENVQNRLPSSLKTYLIKKVQQDKKNGPIVITTSRSFLKWIVQNPKVRKKSKELKVDLSVKICAERCTSK